MVQQKNRLHLQARVKGAVRAHQRFGNARLCKPYREQRPTGAMRALARPTEAASCAVTPSLRSPFYTEPGLWIASLRSENTAGAPCAPLFLAVSARDGRCAENIRKWPCNMHAPPPCSPLPRQRPRRPLVGKEPVRPARPGTVFFQHAKGLRVCVKLVALFLNHLGIAAVSILFIKA